MPEEFEEEAPPSNKEPGREAPSDAEAELLQEGEGSQTEESKGDPWKEKYIRLLADFDNFRKRSGRDLEESRKFANESILRAFLPVLDNLERALQHVGTVDAEGGAGCKSLVEGVRLTQKQFLELLEKNHVVRVQSEGASFDPEVHEAVGYTETDTLPEGMIVDVYQQGYRIHNRLIRPSMVTVSKGKPS